MQAFTTAAPTREGTCEETLVVCVVLTVSPNTPLTLNIFLSRKVCLKKRFYSQIV